MLFFKKKEKKPQTESKMKNECLKAMLPYYFRYRQDAVFITTSKTCPCCKEYNEKIYNVLNMNVKYPPLPEFCYQNNCPECGTVIDAKLYMKA